MSLFSRQEIKILLAVMGLGVMARTYDIRQPFIDSWCRQEAVTAMVAENFYLHGFNILRPQVNWRLPENERVPLMAGWDDRSAGYAGTEFPLVPFLAAVSYLLVGVTEWPGRLLSVGFFALSLPFFYLVERRILRTQTAAMFATAVFSLMPLSIFMGREFTPDMASLCLSIIGLYFFIDSVENESHLGSVWLAGLATSLAILLRLPAITIGLAFFYICWKRFGPDMYSTARLWGILALAFLPPLVWYGYAYQLSVAYSPYYFFWQGGIASLDAYLRTLYSTAITGVTPFITAAILTGLFLPDPSPATDPARNFGRLFHWWLLPLILYVVVAGESNAHPLAQAAIVPIGAAMAGRVFDFGIHLAGRRVLLVAGAVLFLCGVAISAYAYLRPWYRGSAEFLRAGVAINQLTSPGALVLLPGDGNPVTVYYSRRKCLYFPNPSDESDAITQLEAFHGSGATHIVFTSSTRYWLDRYQGLTRYLHQRYRLLRESGDATLFALLQDVPKPSGRPVVSYRLVPSAMRRFPLWAHAVLWKPPTEQELIDLALELHAKYPETHFHICDDAAGLPQLDRVADDMNLIFPEIWFQHHYFGMINVIDEGGYQQWRLVDPKQNNKILADLADRPYRPWQEK